MDVKTALAATPWIRRAWRVVPGPFRLPLLGIGAAYLVYYKLSGKADEAEAEAADNPVA